MNMKCYSTIFIFFFFEPVYTSLCSLSSLLQGRDNMGKLHFLFFFFNRKRVLNGQFLNYYYCRQNLVPFSVEIRILGMKKKRGTIYRRACRTLLCWLMSRTLKVNSGAEMWWDTTRQKIVTVNWNNRFIQFNASYKYNLFWTSGHHK